MAEIGFETILQEVKDDINRTCTAKTKVCELAYKHGICRCKLENEFKKKHRITLKKYIQFILLCKLTEMIIDDIMKVRKGELPQIIHCYNDILQYKDPSCICNLLIRNTGMTFTKYYDFVKTVLEIPPETFTDTFKNTFVNAFVNTNVNTFENYFLRNLLQKVFENYIFSSDNSTGSHDLNEDEE